MAPTESTGPYTAVVTGSSGFVATEVVKQLLNKGWIVRGTVRSLSKKEKVQHLQALGEVGTIVIAIVMLLRNLHSFSDPTPVTLSVGSGSTWKADIARG